MKTKFTFCEIDSKFLFDSMHALPHDLLPTLMRLLRPNVAYVTLVQHDAGLGMSCDSTFALLPNLLVLSAGVCAILSALGEWS